MDEISSPLPLTGQNKKKGNSSIGCYIDKDGNVAGTVLMARWQLHKPSATVIQH